MKRKEADPEPIIEKIEVSKSNGSFFYTGIVTIIDDDWLKIDTIKNESLLFRKEQIQQRRIIDDG